MKTKDIKLMVDNGGVALNKMHMDALFLQIEQANLTLKRIAKISKLNKSHHDFEVIYQLATHATDGK